MRRLRGFPLVHKEGAAAKILAKILVPPPQAGHASAICGRNGVAEFPADGPGGESRAMPAHGVESQYAVVAVYAAP